MSPRKIRSLTQQLMDNDMLYHKLGAVYQPHNTELPTVFYLKSDNAKGYDVFSPASAKMALEKKLVRDFWADTTTHTMTEYLPVRIIVEVVRWALSTIIRAAYAVGWVLGIWGRDKMKIL